MVLEIGTTVLIDRLWSTEDTVHFRVPGVIVYCDHDIYSTYRESKRPAYLVLTELALYARNKTDGWTLSKDILSHIDKGYLNALIPCEGYTNRYKNIILVSREEFSLYNEEEMWF